MKKHKGLLINGDCNTVKIDSVVGKVDLVLTDPPYNIKYKYNSYNDNMKQERYISWQLELMKKWYKWLKPDSGNLLYLNYPETASIIWERAIQLGYVGVEQIFWIYNTHTGGKPLRKGTRVWLWLCTGDSPYIDYDFLKGEYKNPTDRRVKKLIEAGRRPADYDHWRYEQVKNVSKEKTEHPCQLPLVMVKRLVCASCHEYGIVVDPFMGSGTTAEACAITKRHFIGIEQDEEYFDICCQRSSEFKIRSKRYA
jgi:site-specific DNA-methyltransferase (adenine-specific)